jgi:hypothetical protein
MPGIPRERGEEQPNPDTVSVTLTLAAFALILQIAKMFVVRRKAKVQSTAL